MDPITGIATGVSLLSGISGGKSAKKKADSAARSRAKIDARSLKLFDLLFKRAQDAEAQGVFDPEKRIAQLERDTGRYEARDAGNLAGAMAVAGYKPGDSEIGVRQDAVKVKYRKFLDQMRDELRSRSFFEQNQAYAMASPNYLQGPAQGADSRIQRYDQQAQGMNPAGFLSNLMPMFNTRKQGIPGATPPDSTNPFWR